MHSDFYIKHLYPLQDKVLQIISELNWNFYLTGGTALSRVYLHHRYSDDLDFFVNRIESKIFQNDIEAFTHALNKEKLSFEIVRSFDDFKQLFVIENETKLKIDFVNDVGFHKNGIDTIQGFGKVDNPINILSNKITALQRNAAKDFSDILFLCRNYEFEWEAVWEDAKKKDNWAEEITLFEHFQKFEIMRLEEVQWIHKFDYELAKSDFQTIATDVFYKKKNTLYTKK